MIDDHICDGDMILLERVPQARDGEIVVALVAGSDATLKRFYRERCRYGPLAARELHVEAYLSCGERRTDTGQIIGRTQKVPLVMQCGRAKLLLPRVASPLRESRPAYPRSTQ